MEDKIVAVREFIDSDYCPLMGEVAEEDSYKLRDLITGSRHKNAHFKTFDFMPDTIVDLGANIGIFSGYARLLFPEAFIIAVEPDETNLKEFKTRISDDNLLLIEAGIGTGTLYRQINDIGGAHESYLSETTNFSRGFLTDSSLVTQTKSIMLTDIKRHIKGKTIMKMDIEGNESVIFEDEDSMEILRDVDYLVGELHFFARYHEKVIALKKETMKKIYSLSDTHIVEYKHPLFFATKKEHYVQKEL